MPCWRATGSQGVMSSSRRRTGTPCGRAISRRSTSKGACASARRSTNRLPAGETEVVVHAQDVVRHGPSRHHVAHVARGARTSGLRAARGSTWAAARACWRSSPRSAAPRTSMPWTSTTGPMRTAARMSPPTASRTVSTPMLGDVRRIAGRRYDFILANINRNILVADMSAYAAALAPGGDLVMSGFLEAGSFRRSPAPPPRGANARRERLRDGWPPPHDRDGRMPVHADTDREEPTRAAASCCIRSNTATRRWSPTC